MTLIPQSIQIATKDGAIPLPAELASIVQAYQRASKAGSTVRAYRSDALLFEAWCAGYGLQSLPASPAAVAGFLTHEAENGRAASTIGRRCAAIGYAHKLAGLPDPTDNEDVRATMKGVRRTDVTPDDSASHRQRRARGRWPPCASSSDG